MGKNKVICALSGGVDSSVAALLIQKAIKKKTGARGLRAIMENILLKTMYDLPGMDNIQEVIIDANSAKGLSEPILVHSKNDPKSMKSSKTTAA